MNPQSDTPSEVFYQPIEPPRILPKKIKIDVSNYVGPSIERPTPTVPPPTNPPVSS